MFVLISPPSAALLITATVVMFLWVTVESAGLKPDPLARTDAAAQVKAGFRGFHGVIGGREVGAKVWTS
ncbi:hypothetical protein [Amycolatopsis sp. lyj-112]|uniref:hypothetical protein n=1 Tax=Amycolatopsis sp. lyj-112 TaxID=2789288 RepID=UPI00397E3129